MYILLYFLKICPNFHGRDLVNDCWKAEILTFTRSLLWSFVCKNRLQKCTLYSKIRTKLVHKYSSNETRKTQNEHQLIVISYFLGFYI